MKKQPQCARCPIPKTERICLVEGGKAPAFCPTRSLSKLIPLVLEEYQKPEVKEFGRMASIQEAECYAGRKPGAYVIQPTKSRAQETIEFAHKLGFEKLGVAFCSGLQREAELLSDLLEANGFEVVSVVCKVGRVLKETIGIRDDQKVHVGTKETMCNPLLQAEVLNQQKTQLNILLGLCVGHDALFLRAAKAPCTVLAAKDRVTGHNPLAAIYTLHSYYRKLMQMTNKEGK